MTVPAGVGIMRVLVALDTIGGRREVHRPGLPGLLDADMAFVAVDSFEHVRTMLESTVLFVPFEAKHFGARSSGAGQHDQGCNCEELPHFFPCQVC
jgi:hypothetical protein